MTQPPPGSEPELRAFAELQSRLPEMFRQLNGQPLKPRTVLVVPSLTLHPEELAKVAGVHHYEERMLCMLSLLRFPRTRLIFVTSRPVDPTIIDYYLHLLPGIPSGHARRRLTLLACHDASNKSLTEKLLDRPRLLERIRSQLGDLNTARLSCFNVTTLERSLAVRLGIPVYGCDPALAPLGSKSGSREAFAAAGIRFPEGVENLRDMDEAREALAKLKADNRELKRAVVKLNEGFSGEGNALFSFEGAPRKGALDAWLKEELPKRLRFEAPEESFERFSQKFEEMGGVVEEFVEGVIKNSPSVQCRVNPLGQAEVISTHDQVLGGPQGQVFLGCSFPASEEYRVELKEAGLKVAQVLRDRGVLGYFGIDFVSVRMPDRWEHYAIEINLRKGGTTHPFMLLQLLTDGAYDARTGLYRMPTGQSRYYSATDNLRSESYMGLVPDDLIDLAVDHGLHFDAASQEGVVFHLIGALSEFGKLG
ncbi:MAG: ATP-grasp domain-containing protein, partial [Acidobacteria bacterium]|nr:ATP-grasp domain-containing protein [Acidobacteriota bacterium]